MPRKFGNLYENWKEQGLLTEEEETTAVQRALEESRK
jgi:hypothetical protein